MLQNFMRKIKEVRNDRKYNETHLLYLHENGRNSKLNIMSIFSRLSSYVNKNTIPPYPWYSQNSSS